MAPKKQPLLSRLRTTIRKVTFLLSFDRNRWPLPSFLGLKWGQTRRLSFEEWPAGLIDIAHQDSDAESTFRLSRSASLATDRSRSATPVREILRSTSLVSRSTAPAPEVVRSVSDASSSTEDIDQKAEDFIANFYRQLRMERQISLELRYCRGNYGPDRTPSR